MEKWLVRVAADGETVLERRRSPKHGAFVDIFDELVHFPQLVAHPNLTLEILLVRQEEIRRVRKTREKPARRTCFPARVGPARSATAGSGGTTRDCNACGLGRIFCPTRCRRSSPTATLRAKSDPIARAQSMTYVLRRLEVIQMAGKRGRANLYVRGDVES